MKGNRIKKSAQIVGVGSALLTVLSDNEFSPYLHYLMSYHLMLRYVTELQMELQTQR